jgi:large repetitive protein
MDGTAPYTFTATGLPAGLSINPGTGQITGTPTTANPGGATVLVTATDSAFPPETVTYSPTIRIGDVIHISPATLPNGTLGVQYSIQLTATGGIGGLVFGPPGLPNGGTLDSNGTITFANPQVSSVSFTVSVHDQANPFQVETANYTINFVAASNLTFVTQPSNTGVNQTITPAVRVQALDNSAAVIPGASITLTLSAGQGVLSGTLTQVTDATGIATFPNLSINAPGTGYTLQASIGTITALSNPFNITGTPPAPPTNVTGGNNQLSGAPVLNWTASTSSGVTGYNVYRGTTPTGPFTSVGSMITTTTFTDPNAPGACGGTTFYYVITAVGPGGESVYSNEVSVVVQGPC